MLLLLPLVTRCPAHTPPPQVVCALSLADVHDMQWISARGSRSVATVPATALVYHPGQRVHVVCTITPRSLHGGLTSAAPSLV